MANLIQGHPKQTGFFEMTTTLLWINLGKKSNWILHWDKDNIWNNVLEFGYFGVFWPLFWTWLLIISKNLQFLGHEIRLKYIRAARPAYYRCMRQMLKKAPSLEPCAAIMWSNTHQLGGWRNAYNITACKFIRGLVSRISINYK